MCVRVRLVRSGRVPKRIQLSSVYMPKHRGHSHTTSKETSKAFPYFSSFVSRDVSSFLVAFEVPLPH